MNGTGLVDLEKEKQLVEAAQLDPESFGLLFDQYYPVILNYAIKRTGDVGLAQDITAETFYKAMLGIKAFQWRGTSISHWFYRIATNEIRMAYRQNKYRPSSLDELFAEGFEVADEHNFLQEIIDAQDALERQQTFMRTRAVLMNLPLKYQEVITLRFIEKKKVSEIAHIIDKKEGTVKSLLSRGIKKLKREVDRTTMQPNEDLGIIPSEGPVILTSQEAYED